MNITIKKTFMLVFCCFLTLVFCANFSEKKQAWAAEEKTYNWIVGLSVADNTVPVLVCRRFGELLSEKSGGRIKLNVYPNGEMGGDIEIGENVQSGTYNFLCNMPSNTTIFVPKGAIFDLCGVFSTREQARTAVDGEFGKLIDKAYQEVGFKILGWADMGFRMLTSNKEVKQLSDVAGLKVRVIENPHHVAFWKAIGTNPTPVDWAETYLALQQGTVNGCEQPYAFIVSNKLYEVQKYIYKTNHLFQFVQLIMNKKLYDSLSDKDRDIVNQSAAEASAYGREVIAQQEIDAEKFLIDYGTKIVDAPKDLKDKISEVADDYAPTIIGITGEELFKAYIAPTK
ncbi:MAG: TRAP transporter substrate-binding protein [Synergistaceae bacterium]|jgi:tripartite ATP-independent transporter DctP family solute receptor|nr:TRAP transporter substrate-binding protein [Synergistaceae bacterium]